MKTRRAVSTVCYNTDSFLIAQLNRWIDEGTICFWVAIKHKGEADDKKDHWNIYIKPDKYIETSNLLNDLIEVDPNNPLPLRARPFQFSNNFDDWFLYHSHDVDYLFFKGLERIYHYTIDDFITSSPDWLRSLYSEIDRSPYSGYRDLITAFDNHKTFNDLIRLGKIPLNRVVQYATVWKNLQADKNLIDNSAYVDASTGEIKNIKE